MKPRFDAALRRYDTGITRRAAIQGSGGAIDPLIRPGARPRHPVSQYTLRRYDLLRKSFPMTELALPARTLRDHRLARWARQQRAAIDVHTSEELAIAIANGITPSRMVVHADVLCDAELRRAVNLGVGRVIVGSIAQIEFVAACVDRRTQGLLVRMTDPSAPDAPASFGFPFATRDADQAVGVVLDHRHLELHGLHVKVGMDEHASISCPAAIGNMVGEMAHLRCRHGLVLTRLGLDCGDWGMELRQLLVGIDEAVDDGCEVMRYPRPRVLVSTGSIVARPAAA
ncbi:LysA protein [Mycobacterium sp.]|uniref:LysA protein n=1 Tax=Mycobacterium sp. TaxID=1785 RepID=UPI002D765ADA|nr:LysA protein [Mycobacterium sp.]